MTIEVQKEADKLKDLIVSAIPVEQITCLDHMPTIHRIKTQTWIFMLSLKTMSE